MVVAVSLREISISNPTSGSALHRQILWAGNRDLIRASVRAFGDEGLTMVEVTDGYRAIERLCTDRFAAAIIDLDLPPFDDFTVVASWRLTDTPILAITSKIDAADAIAALEMGADDYIRRPYLDAELRARLRALLRRTSPSAFPSLVPGVISIGGLTIDSASLQVWKRGREVNLSATEFKLLLALVREEGRVLSREALVRKAWGYDFLGSSRLVDMTIARLRRKIEDDPKEPEYVLTIRGMGYLLQAPEGRKGLGASGL
jgi:DNA-binding response OmpR family regulator